MIPLLLVPLLLATETLDAFRLDAPAGFTAERGTDHLGFTRTDEPSGTFCQIAIYASRPSHDTLEKEFGTEWQQVAGGTAK